jgi:hypothetical protein
MLYMKSSTSTARNQDLATQEKLFFEINLTLKVANPIIKNLAKFLLTPLLKICLILLRFIENLLKF